MQNHTKNKQSIPENEYKTIKFLINLFFLVPIGFILIGLVNAGGAYNFLGDLGLSPTLSALLVIFLTLVWGAPYYDEVKKKLDNFFKTTKEGEEKEEKKNENNEKISLRTEIAKLINYAIRGIGYLNPFINALGTTIGGYAIAMSFNLSHALCITLTIGGFIAGFIGAAFLTREGINEFADSVKNAIINGPKISGYNIARSTLAISSIAIGAYLAQIYPYLTTKILISLILLNCVNFITYIRNSEEKSIIEKIDSSFKNAAPFLAFLTAGAIAAFNMFAGFHAADAISNVLVNHPLGINWLNNVLGYASLILTLVAAGSFFGMFSQKEFSKAHEEMQKKANETHHKSNSKVKIQLFLTYTLAFIPTIVTTIMIYGSIIDDLGPRIGAHAAQIIGVMVAIASLYLCYRLFTNSLSLVFGYFFDTIKSIGSIFTPSGDLSKDKHEQLIKQEEKTEKGTEKQFTPK